MEQKQETRAIGRPSKADRKQRINVTFLPETLAELESRIPLKQRSSFIEKLVRRELGLKD